MTTFEHVLHGCAPVPLAGYLKGLGVFRLVAEQADHGARGFWRDERFVLRTRLSEDALVRFFTDLYEPTPVIAPWNGGSGFWPKDNREGIDAMRASNAPRLASYRAAIDICDTLVREHKLSEAPKDHAKEELMAALRAFLPDDGCRWLDSALALTADGPRYSPILGTGGNDGRLDFSNNFMRRLSQVISATTDQSVGILQSSLFSIPGAHLEKGAVGQFAPGAAGGLNAGTGFEADSRVNPWDFVLTVEGALLFAAAAVRRHAHDRSTALAFPFTTRTTGAGSGAASLADEADARAEFWAPLWSRVACLDETLVLMSEGRAVLDCGAARDGLDFARAAAQLGIARGIDGFQRYGFLMRAGKAFFAAPLGRVRVPKTANEKASLISELDRNGWLSRARATLRDKGAPMGVTALGRSLDEALFRLAGDDSTNAVQEALITLGALMHEVTRRPKLRENLRPPPRLSHRWPKSAHDDSHEFALAAALASLGASAAKRSVKAAPAERESADTPSLEMAERLQLPFRCHLGPVDIRDRHDDWADGTEAQSLVVWTGRDLVRDMAAVLERRLIENERRHFVDENACPVLPLGGARAAPLSAVSGFLFGRTDDGRIAALAAGLAWARPHDDDDGRRGDTQLPFAYAATKPLFAPDGIGPKPEQKRIVDPLPLVRLIRVGRSDDAVALAQRLARGAGLSTPFATLKPTLPVNAARLAAALLFPITGYDALIKRAYPDLTKEGEEDSDAA